MPAKATKEINKTDICPKKSPEEERKTFITFKNPGQKAKKKKLCEKFI